MPTITAPGVPQATGRPSWLFRQIIFIIRAGAGGGASAARGAGFGAAAWRVWAGAQPPAAPRARMARAADVAGKWVMACPAGSGGGMPPAAAAFAQDPASPDAMIGEARPFR